MVVVEAPRQHQPVKGPNAAEWFSVWCCADRMLSELLHCDGQRACMPRT